MPEKDILHTSKPQCLKHTFNILPTHDVRNRELTYNKSAMPETDIKHTFKPQCLKLTSYILPNKNA